MTHFPPSPGSVPMFWRECLHIGDAGSPEEVGDARPPHRGGHRLARRLDAGQQLRQVTCSAASRLIGEVVHSRRRPLLGPSSG